ncbi:MAG: folate-binding protein YgfZ [Saprospiraceae bacterium]|nr:folate-binding protein YgfZ [Pyrinomonadaceae bacterium]
MNEEILKNYNHIRDGGTGFYEQKRGLIAVWGKEAVQFLNGLITNDVAKLEDGGQMLAAFPNVQGRLLAIVRVLRNGDKFLFETDKMTREKVFNNLFRFTYAGDFFVEDLSDNYKYFEIFNESVPRAAAAGVFQFNQTASSDYFLPIEAADAFRTEVAADAIEISAELYEILRIESGVPKYGVDMDETTVVLETGLDEAVSFTKGCYIGQEIIARIHFRGHVAKQLTGIVLSVPPAVAGGSSQPLENSELKTLDGKNAGKITSIKFSPKLGNTIALAFVRYDYLLEGTELKVKDLTVTVKTLPFL